MNDYPEQTVAVVGLSCRLPGARSVDEYWANLLAGVESVTKLTDEQLRAAGVADARAAESNYVPWRGIVPDHDRFDAAFFGYSPREAELMDPQQRLFLQHSYDALNNAGYAPHAVPARVGVYAGATKSTHPAYLEHGFGGDPRILFGNEEDHLAARVAYKLDLRGPSMCVHTACSSSLVAVHLAVQALLVGDCDLALAGGVSVDSVQHRGHLYQDGGILSPDGHCRAFDARAAGSVSGGGVGVVVLRRLADAVADGDTVHALIRGSAVNNDGADRVGYTAPGVAGQASVVADALAAADVEAATIGLVEAHGTATPVGDPIEVSALHRVFGPRQPGLPGCVLGSVKTNIGHLDAASGVAGLIKAVLAVRTGLIPPTLHFTEPNPMIDFTEGPFRVATETQRWTARPRRAGVSSFGIGGTNVHVVVEEPPRVSPAPSRAAEVLLVSGRTDRAADTALGQLLDRLAAEPGLSLSDVAHTLAVGREQFAHRRAVLRSGTDTVAEYHGTADPGTSAVVAPTESLSVLAEAWVHGAVVDWAAVHGPGRHRVPLPGYPFDPTPFPVAPRSRATHATSAERRSDDVADWLWMPVWQETAPLVAGPEPGTGRVLLFALPGDLGDQLGKALRRAGGTVTTVRPGDGFHLQDGEYRVRPDQPSDYVRLLADVRTDPSATLTVLHCWTATTGGTAVADLDEAARNGCHSLICLARAISAGNTSAPVRVYAVAGAVHDVTGADRLAPGNAQLVGPCRVIPQELPHVRCVVVDVEPPRDRVAAAALAGALVAELGSPAGETTVALRGFRRWVRSVARLPAEPAGAPLKLRRGGVYLITGGLGRIGLLLAEHLAETVSARLVLIGRSAPRYRTGDDDDSPLAARLRTIEQLGGEVLTLPASVGDDTALRSAVAEAVACFGRIDGVIHAAGVTEGPSTRYLTELDPADCGPQFTSKVWGTVALDQACAPHRPDFVLLMSSISVFLGGVRLAAYAGANAFLDAYARARDGEHGVRWLSVGWDAWLIGETIGVDTVGAKWNTTAMSGEEGVAVVDRLWSRSWRGQVVVSTTSLPDRIARWVRRDEPVLVALRGRPAGATADRIRELWCDLLGLSGVDDDESFFAVGGDSLMALQLMNSLQQEFGVPLPAATMFSAPTVTALAAVVDDRRPAGDVDAEIAAEVAALSDDAVERMLTELADGEVD